MRVLGWPSKSPDLNPIENLWGIVARQVYGKGKQYHTKTALIQSVKAAWNSISLETIRSLIKSMATRLIKVVENKGAFTH